MKLIFQYFRQAIRLVPRLFAVSMCLIFLLTAMDTFVPWGLRKYIEQLTEQNSYVILLGGLALFVVYLFAKIFVDMAWYVSLDYFGGKYVESLSLSLERAMANTYYSEIEKINPGIIRNVLFTDVLNVFRVIGHHVPLMLGAFTVVLACVAVSLVYNVKVTIFILAAAMIGFLISWCSRKILAKSAGQTNAKLKVHDSWCTQFVEMLPLIQSHNILDYYQKHTAENLKSFVDTAVVEDKKTLFWSGMINSYHSLFSIALSAVLAIPISGNSISDLVFFTMLADLVMQQTQKAETMFQQIMKLHVSFVHVDELQHLPQKSGSMAAEQIESICFRSVYFSYPNKENVLQNLSCYLEKGDMVRLAGANGSGKSTFIKLITGLYQPTKGELFLDGKPIGEYSKESLNKQILYINQDEKCLNETFLDYLKVITSHNITEKQYLDLLDLVRLPEDGRTIEGNGDSLSVGQRKKLFILKLMLRLEEASVIILDELTAGLDAETTQQVYDFIRQAAAAKNKIILLVDHNMEEEIGVMKTFLFEDGKIDELLCSK